MGELMSFTLTSGIILLSMYLPYRLLLAGEKQHRLNRVILLAIYMAAIVIPLVRPVALPGISGIEAGAATAETGIAIGKLSGGLTEHSGTAWMRVLLWIYIAGAAVALVWLVWAYARLSVIIWKGKKIKMEGYTLVVTGNKNFSPFSWRGYVVVEKISDATEYPAIMIHEMRHLSACHDMDLMLAQLYAVLVWYNPASWLMIDELKTVHEYEADEAVIDSGLNLRDYQMLLIKKAVGARLPSLANSLNHSKLQKRITMMYQSKSRTAGKLGSLVLVPALAIGIAVVSIPAVASVISGASETTLLDSDSKVSKISANTESLAEMRAIAPASDNKAFTAVEKLAEFPGGIEAMMKWLQYNVKYPKEAEKAGEQGKAVVKFTVNKDGSISNATIIKSVSPSIDKEALRVVTSMPKCKPAENGGKKVACWYALPVSFRLAPDKETTKK